MTKNQSAAVKALNKSFGKVLGLVIDGKYDIADAAGDAKTAIDTAVEANRLANAKPDRHFGGDGNEPP